MAEKKYLIDNAELMAEWDWSKNTDLDPHNLTLGSNKKAWWKCSKGHEWHAMINNRNNGRCCPYCANNKILRGYNDLQTVNPTLSEEWNYEKNNGLTPADVMPNSGKKAWWKCSKGHEWQARIESRNQGNECPICSSERKTSFPEYAIIYYLKKYGLDAIHLYKEKGYELDIFIPSKNIAIEYDGNLWHKNKTEQDLDKNAKCKKDGIKLYRIREGLSPLNDSSLDYVVQKGQKDLSIILEQVISEIIGKRVYVDLKRDAVAVENLREFTEKENSLLFSNPEIANEWNYKKNGTIRPEHFTSNSGKKVWWKCSNGHEWQAMIAHRNNGIGCPYCAGKKVLKGYNDLQTVNPALANEWNREKNGNLKPEQFTANNGKKVWWKCSWGHEWQAKISNRNNGSGCPYCSGRYAIKGETDLQTVNPDLAKEWDYEKNNGLTPMDVTPNSHIRVWWKCSQGHEWQAIVANRNKGRGCPSCWEIKRKHKS